MPAFEYTALNSAGRTCKGVQEGDTPRQVRQHLREQQLTPLSVEEVIRKNTRQRRRGDSLSAADLALLTRQLATLVKAGLALEEALRAVAEQSEKATLKSLILAVRSKVVEGHSLAEGLKAFPQAFPEIYQATVAAGEQSGHLDVVLERLADYTESRQQLQNRVLLALFYPALLSSVALLVVFGLLAYVVPEVVQVFTHLQQELPWLTRFLIQLSDFLNSWGLLLFFAVLLLFLAMRYWLRFESAKIHFHHLILRLPVIGRLERGVQAARFTRTLSILNASGVPLLEGLKIAAAVLNNLPMRQAVQKASERVREGSSLYNALSQSKLFPPITLHLIASGENSGELEAMLERAAQNQEHEVQSLIAVALGLFEPLLILLMGGVVLTIVLAILMPIFELNQLVQ
ncbi:type II secretion system inner membrane protein GspF [Candidatus Venteria ishoeyi]|uniref:General secretion pathway protein F n=3 Tax=Candidatus Venteria ishoeyi TaxID=1899563 RepID=A0A1H6FC93_9GAMM|nr:type II secretion system inner membrane protein GspF [Candidatus Venteria ishoeyi]SEH07253.1 Type II secretion system protein F [Candidatus Venteria ishoeyi]